MLSQVRQEKIDRRIQEKEEEFEHSRKNHQKALDTRPLKAEARAKGRGSLIGRSMNLDINEMEIALIMQQGSTLRPRRQSSVLHMQLSDVNAAIEEERKIKNEVSLSSWDSLDRKANAMFTGEMEES